MQELLTSRRFKYKPFEWLYKRLNPLLVQRVLETRDGIPLTLSVIYSSVALRLGIPLLPQRVPPPSTGTLVPCFLLRVLKAVPPACIVRAVVLACSCTALRCPCLAPGVHVWQDNITRSEVHVQVTAWRAGLISLTVLTQT